MEYIREENPLQRSLQEIILERKDKIGATSKVVAEW